MASSNQVTVCVAALWSQSLKKVNKESSDWVESCVGRKLVFISFRRQSYQRYWLRLAGDIVVVSVRDYYRLQLYGTRLRKGWSSFRPAVNHLLILRAKMQTSGNIFFVIFDQTYDKKKCSFLWQLEMFLTSDRRSPISTVSLYKIIGDKHDHYHEDLNTINVTIKR